MRRILLLGKNGQLGWELNRTLITLGDVIALDYPEIDFTKTETIRSIIREIKPHVILNAVAYTNVDKAEEEPEIAKLVNTVSPLLIAEEANRLQSMFIHYSTDYVFDGTKGQPYLETDIPNPLNIYGETKLEAERGIAEIGKKYFVFRTSWLYSLRQGGFVSKVLEWAKKTSELKIVNDQFGSPTWSRALAEATAQIICNDDISNQNFGVYNLAGNGGCSRYEWAKAILELYPHRDKILAQNILPVTSDFFPSSVSRPKNTILNCDKIYNTFGIKLPFWKNALSLMLSER